MKFTWFDLMPWPDLPKDFREKHRSVWVDIDANLFDPARSHEIVQQDCRGYRTSEGSSGGRTRLRNQSGGCGYSVPSRGAGGWHDGRLSLGGGSQKTASCAGRRA